jgi:uncharacterized protein (TIGR02466 family)
VIKDLITTLFPKFVYSTFYEDCLTKENWDFINTTYYKKNQFNNVSIDSQILKNKKLINLNIFINKVLNNFLQNFYKPKNNLEIYITESWLNVTQEKEQHHNHKHVNSFLSGVFYLKTNLNDSITFFNKYENFEIETVEYNDFTAAKSDINVKDNQLILFPSSIEHSVKVNNCKDPRVSIAFNTFLRGNVNSLHTTCLNL